MKAKVYLASSWRNELYVDTLASLRELDVLDIYDFRNPEPGSNGFHWSEIDPNWRNWTVEEFCEGLKHPIADEGFSHDWNALQDADILILVLLCGKSAHLEAGYAIGAGKPTAIYCPVEHTEPELMYKMCQLVTNNLDELKAWAEEQALSLQANLVKDQLVLPL